MELRRQLPEQVVSSGSLHFQKTYNAANQLISESSTAQTVTHQYDQWGNETVRTTTPAGQSAFTETYGYNHLNLMSSFTNSQTGANWQYDFYPTGERYAKTNLGTNTSELYVPRFDDVATEYDKIGAAAATLKNAYVQAPLIDSKRLRIAFNPNGTEAQRRHLLGDQVGTVGMTLDDTASIIDTSVKDAWGVQMSGSTSERYGGMAQRELDTESGLTYMRHRMYDPKLGRFTQTDPIRGNRPTEHYAYGGNNPISRSDPMGDRWIASGTGAAGMIADLEKYTGRRIEVSSSGTVSFGCATHGEEFASKSDMEWIRRVENDDSATDITGCGRI